MTALLVPLTLSGTLPRHKVRKRPCKDLLDAVNTTSDMACVDGINVTYFRGRKLHGRAIALPERYQGAVVERAAIDEKQHKATAPSLEDGDDQEINESETATMLVTAEFDEIMIWGHEEMADAHEDMYVRGVEEWVQVAEKVSTAGREDLVPILMILTLHPDTSIWPQGQQYTEVSGACTTSLSNMSLSS